MNLKELIFGGGAGGAPQHRNAFPGSSQEWIPIHNIIKGVVITTDRRYVKILEVLPINFYTLSELEKDGVISDYAAYLKIAPASLQTTVVTQKFDLDGYVLRQKGFMESEQNGLCRDMIADNIAMAFQTLH